MWRSWRAGSEDSCEACRTVAGSRVRKGDLLVLLDDRDLQAQADKTKGAEQEVLRTIEEASQHLRAAESGKRLATNTFERIRASTTGIPRANRSTKKRTGAQRRSRSRMASGAGPRADQAQSHAVTGRLRPAGVRPGSAISASPLRLTGVVTSVPADEGSFVSPGQVAGDPENPATLSTRVCVEQEDSAAIHRHIRSRSSFPPSRSPHRDDDR